MPTDPSPTALPMPRWVTLLDGSNVGHHVEVLHGASRTACGKDIPSGATRSDKAQPTICDKCRLHYRAEKKRPRTVAGGGLPSPPPATTKAERIAAVEDAVVALRHAVARCRGKYGRDTIRQMPWGTTLDAMDAGRDELHPDDVQAHITDRAFVRWFLNKPVHQRVKFMREAMAGGDPRNSILLHVTLDKVVIYVSSGVVRVLGEGAKLCGTSIDRVLYTGPACDEAWLRDAVGTRFASHEAREDWERMRAHVALADGVGLHGPPPIVWRTDALPPLPEREGSDASILVRQVGRGGRVCVSRAGVRRNGPDTERTWRGEHNAVVPEGVAWAWLNADSKAGGGAA